MVVKFRCTINDKKKYYAVKSKINFHKGTFLREKTFDLKSGFSADIEVAIMGRTLYRELEESGLCETLSLFPGN